MLKKNMLVFLALFVGISICAGNEDLTIEESEPTVTQWMRQKLSEVSRSPVVPIAVTAFLTQCIGGMVTGDGCLSFLNPVYYLRHLPIIGKVLHSGHKLINCFGVVTPLSYAATNLLFREQSEQNKIARGLTVVFMASGFGIPEVGGKKTK